MSRRNRSGCGCLSLLGTVIVLAAGGTGVYFYLRGNLPGQEFTPLKAATLVPQDAFATSYVSTNAKDWSKLEKFGTPEAKQVISKGLKDLQEDITKNQQINFQKDIKPWLGGLSFAFLPSTTNPNQSDILLIAGIKDKLKALDFAKKMQNQPGQTTQEVKYNGITITETTTANNHQFASAVLGNYLVVADKISVIEQAIDTFKGEPSFAEKEGVTQLLQQKMTLKSPLVRFYINDYQQIVQQSSPRSLPAPDLQQIKGVQSIVVGIGAENEGLHLQAVANLSPDNKPAPLKPIHNKTFSQFPTETFMLIQGQGIKQGWIEMVKQSKNDPELGDIVSEIRQSFRQANLDADKDVFSWLDGQFSVGLINLPYGGVANFGIGGMIVLETSDRPTGEQSLNKISQMARFMPFIEINQRTAQGIDLTEWSMPQQGVIASYGWLNGREMVLALGSSYETIQQQSSQATLSQSPQYKSLISGLPNQALGSFYLNVEQITAKMEQVSPTNVSSDAQVILDSIKGVAMTVTLPDTTTSQADVFLTFKTEP